MEEKRHFLNDKRTKRFFRLTKKAEYHLRLQAAGYPNIHAQIAHYCAAKARKAAREIMYDPAHEDQVNAIAEFFGLE